MIHLFVKIKNKLFANLGMNLILNRSMLQYNSIPNTIPSDFKKYKEYLWNMISAKINCRKNTQDHITTNP